MATCVEPLRILETEPVQHRAQRRTCLTIPQGSDTDGGHAARQDAQPCLPCLAEAVVE